MKRPAGCVQSYSLQQHRTQGKGDGCLAIFLEHFWCQRGSAGIGYRPGAVSLQEVTWEHLGHL